MKTDYQSKKLKKILFVCPYPENIAAGQRLKFEPHFSRLEELGYEVTAHNFMTLKLWNIISKEGHNAHKILGTLLGLFKRLQLLFSIRKYDCVYIFMNVFPFGPPILESLYVWFSKKVIFDVEDNMLTSEQGSINWLASVLKSRTKIKFLLKNADYIIASSPDLVNQCNNISGKKNARFIPPTLDEKRFIPKTKDSNLSEIVIGWTGTFSSKNFLEMIVPHLESLYEKRKFKLMVIGNFDYTNEKLDLEVIKWNEDHEIQQLQNFDIGLYPLPSNDWVSGKSGLKAMQYMAIGIPAVCSAVGNALTFIENNEDGVLVFNESEWIDVLTDLIDNAKKRDEIGKNARQKFLQNFSKETIFQKYLNIIDN